MHREAKLRRLRAASIVVVAVACTVSAGAQAAGYTATLLSPIAGANAQVQGIDAAGTAYGQATTGAGYEMHAVMWVGGVPVDLTGAAGLTGSWRGYDGNPAGQAIVGGWPGGNFTQYLLDNGVLVSLPAYGCCSASINSAGVVAYQNNQGVATLFDGLGTTALGTFGGDSAQPVAVSDAGHVAGYRFLSGADLRAFVWKAGAATIIEPLAGSAPGNSTIALDVNEAGQVLVMSSVASDPNAWHVAIWKDGELIDTGISATENTIPAGGYVINNGGQVLAAHGVWKDGVFSPLATLLPPEVAEGVHEDGSYWLFHELKDINDAGQIVGMALRYDLSTMMSSYRSFVLTPGGLCAN